MTKSELHGSDAYAPREVALRVKMVGIAKACIGLLLLPMLMLMLAMLVQQWGRALPAGAGRHPTRRLCQQRP